MGDKQRKPWCAISDKEQKIGMKIYRAAKLLRDDGYEKDKALAILRRVNLLLCQLKW
jgi:hypothetical protein